MKKTSLILLLKQRRLRSDAPTHKVKFFLGWSGLGILSLVLIGLAALLVSAGVMYARVAANLPSLDELPVLLNPIDGELMQPTRITDRSGEVTLFTLADGEIKRRYLSVNPEKPAHFSPQLIRAAVVQLEPDFWQTPGYSLEKWNNPEAVTIAERLVSELLLWKESPSLTRSIRMRLLAGQLVTRFGRTQVLEWYLNSAWFGRYAVGAESAAQLYYSKSARDLDLSEAAMLSALIQAPALNPLDAPANAHEMQRELLDKMVKIGEISTEEFVAAAGETLTQADLPSEAGSLAPAFTRQVLAQLQPVFQQNRLVRGGLIIHSTLDLDLQQQFICTAQTQIRRLTGSPASQQDDAASCATALLLPTQSFNTSIYGNLSSAGSVLDAQSGEVLAFFESNPSTYSLRKSALYEPGSLLSPFAALAGFVRGLSPASLEWDVPTDILGMMVDYKNPDNVWKGPVNLRQSIANDYLMPLAEVLQQVGPANAWYLTSKLGLSSLENAPEDPSLLFKEAQVPFMEVAAAYATLANQGVRSGVWDAGAGRINLKYSLTVVSSSGRILYDATQSDERIILSQPLSYLVNNVLSDESARWPSLGYPNALEIGQPVAAKIGSVPSRQQVWTVGYTSQRVVLAWLGIPEDNPTQSLDPLMAAGVWHAVMRKAISGFENPGWSEPEGITRVKVCVPSGLLPDVDCPSTMEEVFLSGNIPTSTDTLYESIPVNRETGLRATVFTNPGMVENQLFINVPASMRSWAVEAGLPVAPAGYDAIPAIQVDPQVHITSPLLFSAVGGQVSILGAADVENLSAWTVQIGQGINPPNWIEIARGPQAIKADGELAVWDTTGLEGLYALRLTVIDRDQHIRTSLIQISVDNTPPQAKIVYPQEGQSVTPVNASITLQADIVDSSGIKQVEWFLDGKLMSTQSTAPWILVIPAAAGDHSLQLTVSDVAGNQTKTGVVQFSVLD